MAYLRAKDPEFILHEVPGTKYTILLAIYVYTFCIKDETSKKTTKCKYFINRMHSVTYTECIRYNINFLQCFTTSNTKPVHFTLDKLLQEISLSFKQNPT